MIRSIHRHCLSAGAALAAACALALPAAAHDPAPRHRHAAETKRSVAAYSIPDLRLLREDGVPVTLAGELSDGRPVVLNFIYTTCTSVCPLTSQVFADLQDRLGAARDRVHMVSISIDPEQDTPDRLRAYAGRFGAGAQWRHYTGTVEASLAVQRAFNAYRGGKMDHAPVTFVRAAPGNEWVRIDGFATADQLIGELRSVVAAAH